MLSGVAGVCAPAFVERAGTGGYVLGATDSVSPEFVLRPLLSVARTADPH